MGKALARILPSASDKCFYDFAALFGNLGNPRPVLGQWLIFVNIGYCHIEPVIKECNASPIDRVITHWASTHLSFHIKPHSGQTHTSRSPSFSSGLSFAPST